VDERRTPPLLSSLDPVLELFEALYFASEDSARARHLRLYLQRRDASVTWVLNVLLEGATRICIRKERLKALLLKQVDEWELDCCRSFTEDLNDCLARLWPGKEMNELANSVDYLAFEHQLIRAPKEQVETTFAAVLSLIDEPRRWLMMQLYVKRYRWEISRRLVFEVLNEVAGNGRELESYWHHLRTHPDALVAILRDTADRDFECIEKGCAFTPMEPPARLTLDEVMSLNPEHYDAVSCPDGIWVQWVVTEVERHLYDHDGNLLDAGFPDLLATCDTAMTCVGLVCDESGEAGYPNVCRRLLSVSRGTVFKKPGEAAVTFWHLQTWVGSEPFPVFQPQISWVRSATHEPVSTWDDFSMPESRIFLAHPSVDSKTNPSWFQILAPLKSVDLVLLYADRAMRGAGGGFAQLTCGLRDATGSWIPITKIPVSAIGILDRDRFDDWAKCHVDFRKGPITEFRKNLVFEVGYSAVKKAPRRKCGLEMQYTSLKRITWEKSVDEVPFLERFVNDCEKA